MPESELLELETPEVETQLETPETPEAETPADDTETEHKKFVAQRDEIRKFKRCVTRQMREDTQRVEKGLNPKTMKPFMFNQLPETYASTLNKFVAVADYEGAKWFADRCL